jgi:hypothetical protein
MAKAKKKNQNSTTLHNEYNISEAKKMVGESVSGGRGENQDVMNPIIIVGFKMGENRIFWNAIGALVACEG